MSEENFKKFLATMELVNQTCMLDHKDNEFRQAVNFICQEMSDGSMIRIPICQECNDALQEKNGKWLLFFCINCTSNQWLNKEKSKREYSGTEKIRWFFKCPKCPGDE